MAASLRVIDGGLNDAPDRRVKVCVSERIEQAESVAKLLSALAPELTANVEQRHNASPGDAQTARLSDLRFSLFSDCQSDPILWTSKLGALRGTFRTLVDKLDVELIAICSDRVETLAQALDLAKAAGRSSPCIIENSGEIAFAPSVGNAVHEIFGADAGLAQMGCLDAIAQFVCGRFPHDVVIARAETAILLETLGAELIGATPLRARCWRYAEGISSAGIASQSDRDVEAFSIAADITALADLLGAAGWRQASMSLSNALIRTLEDNFHTDGIPTIMPYARRVNDVEFIDAVTQRLGKLPKHAKPLVYAPDHSHRQAMGARSSLQLVHSA
ncbi:MAG: hypothetical protein GC152_10435 [Alphaproteobacteria bacterium]|nr:hypothetical protein [Alphaproteobacteria bacterium]